MILTEKNNNLIAGVVGYPVFHSKSPFIHHYWLQQYNIPGIYTPFQVSKENFESFLKIAPQLGIIGLNITMPHKAKALELCTTVSERARRIGAVNTLTFEKDGAISGDNTDGWGFVENLKATINWRPLQQNILIIGAGAAATAVVDALVKGGAASVVISNRTQQRAEDMASRYTAVVQVGSWPVSQADVDQADLIINATSIGLLQDDITAAPWQHLQNLEGKIATDLIYAPLETAFLAYMRRSGAQIVDGLGMLLHQARPGFEKWRGTLPEVTTALREAVLQSKRYWP